MFSQALRFNAGLKRAIFAVILSFLCIFLNAAKGFVVESFAATQDETIIGTMSIVLDNSQEPDVPVPDPINPSPNPGDGNNSNSGVNADGSNNNDDALKASVLNKNDSNKDLLASTGDVFTATLVAFLAIATVLTTCVYVSRRRLATNEGGSYSQTSNKIKSAVLVLLAIVLISGTIFSSFKAFADGEVTDDPTSNTATLRSKVVIDKNGKIKSSDLTIKNNLKTGVTVKSISAPTEVSTWTVNVDANTVIDAEGSVVKDWTPDSDTIPAELLVKLNNGEEVNLEFSSEVSYTAFNVSWYINGGRDETIPVSVIPENSNFVLPAEIPTKEHYTFAGWNTYASGGGVVVDEEYCRTHVVTRDSIFWAKWTPDTYLIDFQFPDGGDFAGGVTPEKSYTYGIGIDSFEEPYRQGYDFDGWYDSASGGNKVTSITTTDFGDKVLYARWTPSTNTQYKVQHIRESLEKDGSYGLYDTVNDVVYEYGSTGEKTNAQPKTYVGFVVSEIGQETIKPDGSTSVNIKYDRIPYTVTFDNNGKGNATLVPKTVKYMRKLTKPTNTISEAGYVFGGWYASQDCVGNEFDFANTSITKDITLYAKWTPITYTVKFDKNDDAATGTMTDQTFTYDTAQTLRTNTFTKSNFTFAGWAETPTGEVKYTDAQEVKNLATAQGSVVTLYAKWNELTTFLAPSTGSVTANPRNISGTKYSIEQVKVAATDIANKGSSSSYYSQYTSWMNADSYHLYTLLNGKDSNSADSWVEFRIVNVGQLDSDGTGLTFQAVHMLPAGYGMNLTDTNVGGWVSSNLRAKMQSGGEIYNMFDSNLTNATYNVTKNSKGKLWIPSYSELTGTSHSYVANDGSQFAYWIGKVTNSTSSNSCFVIAGTRSGDSFESNLDQGCWWERSPNTDSSYYFLRVKSDGNAYDYSAASRSSGIVPCFSL